MYDDVVNAWAMDFVARANVFIPEYARRFSEPGKPLPETISLCAMSNDGKRLAHFPVGNGALFTAERMASTMANAHRKVMAIRIGGSEVISSFQVEAPNANPPVYGGGIRLLGDYGFVALSNWPPHHDEAAAVALAWMVDESFMDDTRLANIKRISNNPHIHDAIAFAGYFDPTKRLKEWRNH